MGDTKHQARLWEVEEQRMGFPLLSLWQRLGREAAVGCDGRLRAAEGCDGEAAEAGLR